MRTYLGARNSVRFIRRHAGPLRTLKFAASTAYNIPLELLAVVVDREEELHLGLLTYRGALARYCLEATGWTRGERRRPCGTVLRAIGRAPVVAAARPAARRPARAGGGPHGAGRGLPARALGRCPRAAAAARAAGAAMRRGGAGAARRGMTGRDVTIVVLNWNGGSDTVDCLESLAAADLEGASVLVVDNGSRDDSLARIRARFPAQRILALPDNRGYAGGNNAGMRAALEAGAGAVLLLNNDTRVAPDFLPPLLSVMHDSPRAGAVTSQILRLDRPEMLDVAYLEVHFDERNVVQLQGVNRLPSEGFDRRRQVVRRAGLQRAPPRRRRCARSASSTRRTSPTTRTSTGACAPTSAAGRCTTSRTRASSTRARAAPSASTASRAAASWRQDAPQLPHAEPMPFNPVRTYLGMRNTVRLLRRYAKPTHRLAFGLDLARLLPLETTAVILGAESEFRLGRVVVARRRRRLPRAAARDGPRARWRAPAALPLARRLALPARPRARGPQRPPRARWPRRCAACATASSIAACRSSDSGCAERAMADAHAVAQRARRRPRAARRRRAGGAPPGRPPVHRSTRRGVRAGRRARLAPRPRPVRPGGDVRQPRGAGDAPRDRRRRIRRSSSAAREAARHGALSPPRRQRAGRPSASRSTRRMAGLLEIFADARRGARLEVLNGATGGWALDNSLEFFRRHGAARAPDLVILVLDPIADLASISPGYLAALGRRVPAKPFFAARRRPPGADSAVRARARPGAGLAAGAARVLPALPAPAPHAGAHRRADGLGPVGDVSPRHGRRRSGTAASSWRQPCCAPCATRWPQPAAGWSRSSPRFPERPVPLIRPDASSASGSSRPSPSSGIPILDLTRPLDVSQRMGRPVYLEGSVRLNGPGHGLAAGAIWGFLASQGLLPQGLVAARMPGSGHAIPPLASLPHAAAEALWGSRHGLAGRFIQFGLLAVCVVWLAAPLPVMAREWVLVGLGVAMLGLLGSWNVALLGAALAFAWYGVVELLPPLPATAVATLLAAALVALTVRFPAMHRAGEPWAAPILVAGASNVALLRLVAYAVDRRRGLPRLRLRTFLAALLFFPTLPAGPIQSPAGFAVRPGAPGLGSPAALARAPGVGLGRVHARAALPGAPDHRRVRRRGRRRRTRAHLWLFVGEVALLFTLLLSGWSHMAIALGRLAGADLPENLRRPWWAPDVAEFWRRWHATLTAWLHAYLYVPLGRGALPVVLVFLASAAWHGWAMTKILGVSGFPRVAWRGLLIWAALNAVAVIGIQARDHRAVRASSQDGAWHARHDLARRRDGRLRGARLAAAPAAAVQPVARPGGNLPPPLRPALGTRPETQSRVGVTRRAPRTWPRRTPATARRRARSGPAGPSSPGSRTAPSGRRRRTGWSRGCRGRPTVP